MIFEFQADVRQRQIGQTPDWEVPGIRRSGARNLLVFSGFQVGYFKVLPYRPCGTIPDEQQKHVVIDKLVVFVRAQDFIRAAREIQIGACFCYKFFRQRVEKCQP
jgi:hypothetical protein